MVVGAATGCAGRIRGRAGLIRSLERRRSREGREIRIARPSKKIRCTIFSSSLEINYLGEGRGDLQSATFSTACFRGGFSRIFEDRGLCSESPARPSAGQNPEGFNLKDALVRESNAFPGPAGITRPRGEECPSSTALPRSLSAAACLPCNSTATRSRKISRRIGWHHPRRLHQLVEQGVGGPDHASTCSPPGSKHSAFARFVSDSVIRS